MDIMGCTKLVLKLYCETIHYFRPLQQSSSTRIFRGSAPQVDSTPGTADRSAPDLKRAVPFQIGLLPPCFEPATGQLSIELAGLVPRSTLQSQRRPLLAAPDALPMAGLPANNEGEKS